MTIFTEDDKEQIAASECFSKLELSSGTYFINGSGYKRATCELLGEKVADLIGLHHMNYYIAIIDCQTIVLSKFQENFQTANELFLEDYYKETSISANEPLSLYDIWIALEKKYGEVEELMKAIVKMYIMDLLLLNDDRNSDNWGINEEDGKREIYVLDHEFALAYETDYMLRIRADLQYKEDDMLKDLKTFLKESSGEFVELTENIFRIITPKKINELLEQIQKESDPENIHEDYYDKIKGRFDRNYEKLKNQIFKAPIEKAQKKI